MAPRIAKSQHPSIARPLVFYQRRKASEPFIERLSGEFLRHILVPLTNQGILQVVQESTGTAYYAFIAKEYIPKAVLGGRQTLAAYWQEKANALEDHLRRVPESLWVPNQLIASALRSPQNPATELLGFAVTIRFVAAAEPHPSQSEIKERVRTFLAEEVYPVIFKDRPPGHFRYWDT